MSYNFESEVSEALGQLLESKTDYNAIIRIGEEPNVKEFHAHSGILRYRSEYFNKELSAKDVKKKDGKYIIKKSNISSQAFDIILKFIYTGRIDITNKTGMELLDIMIASDELNLKSLTKLTKDFIIKNCHQFIRNDPIGILQIVHCHNFNLQKFCLEEICFEPGILFKSDKFTQISASLLEIILKRDDLNLDEIEIWKHLIEWGLAQEPALNKDVSKWNHDDFIIFKRILYKFIPLIRYYEISSKDYFCNVKPYEEILPKGLRDDILKFYMVPEYKPKSTRRFLKSDICSVIINQKHVTLFANWIDRKVGKSQYIKDIPYNLNLLHRASRDGNTSAVFHEKCDNKGATIVIAKIKNSEQIVGGYNPLQWVSSDHHRSTKDSFIFSFKNRNNFQTAEVGYSNGNPYSIGWVSKHGSFFGYNDLYQSNGGIWTNHQHSNNAYPVLNSMPINKKFNVEDYEVFQVIKKP